MSTNNDGKPIRFGVVGGRRGRSFMAAAKASGLELVAICESWEKQRQEAAACGIISGEDPKPSSRTYP